MKKPRHTDSNPAGGRKVVTRMGNFIECKHPLTRAESQTLSRHEKVVERGVKTFIEVGRALMAIRDDARKLYREYGKFEDYCKERWGFQASRARQFIAAAKTAESVDMSTVSNERQAKELTRVPEDQRQSVLDWATEKADGKPLTAAAIRKAAEEVLDAEPDEGEQDAILCDSEPVLDAEPDEGEQDAMSFATAAISQLERIRQDDPKRNDAFIEVENWIQSQRAQ